MGTQKTVGPTASAILGASFVLPFFAANAVVANRIEPLFSFIRPGAHTSSFELVLLGVVLACIPVGAFSAARPLFDRSADRPMRTYLLNGTISAVMVAMFVVVTAALGQEIYRCDVLGIANCD